MLHLELEIYKQVSPKDTYINPFWLLMLLFAHSHVYPFSLLILTPVYPYRVKESLTFSSIHQ